MMYTEVNGKKCANGVFFSLLVWLLSMFCCLSVLFIFGANDELPIKQRVIYPYVAFLAKYTDKACFKEMELELRKYAWIPQAFRLERTLVAGKKTIDSYTNLTSVENLYCYFMHKEAVDKVNKDYEKATDSLKAWHSGDAVPPSQIVQETSAQIQKLTDKLMKTQFTNLSKQQLHSKTLALVLLHAGTFFEYKIDSVGADTATYSKESAITVNGYMKFNAEDYRNNFARYIAPLNFSEVRNEKKHNLAIYLLEKDDCSGTTYWGAKSEFNLETLWDMLGFKKNGDATNGMFAGITLARGKKMFISCDRLSWISGDDFDTIMVNLRPQGWCKWNTTLKSVEETVFNKLKSASALDVAAPAYSECIIPATVTTGKHAAVKHVFFDKASGIAPDAVVEPIISTSQVFINKKKAENKENKIVLSDKNSPVINHIIMQRSLTPEEKAVTAQAKIEEGKKIEETGDYVGAYKLYKQAADLDSDKGRLNCAILLSQNSVTYNDRNGFDISYEVARQFAAETLEKSKDKKYRGFACNILGILYNTGGRGLDQNVSLAIKYFEQGAALGDENAIKNLGELCPEKAPAPKVTPAPAPKAAPAPAPKATPAAAPVVKQPVTEKREPTPEEKAAAAQAKIEEGKNVEETGDFVGAYNLYKKAADLGSDKGRLNCAILLAQNKVTYNNDRGYNVSYEVARQFAAETLEKSKDKKYRGFACNILGILYNTGGRGLDQNVSLAIKYFEQGAALGDENAIKNLGELCPEKAPAPKVTPAPAPKAAPAPAPKATPAAAPVVKQPVTEKREPTPEEKAAAAQAKIEEGKNVEETGDFVGAYRLYKQAADLGSDKGRLNCAILLAQNKVTYNNDRGYNVSYKVARQFAAETLEKSQDKKYRGEACNILGVLYNTGGKGIRRNVSLALKYYEQGAALGDEFAIKNLEDMRKSRKSRR